jgi:hypothetical protein
VFGSRIYRFQRKTEFFRQAQFSELASVAGNLDLVSPLVFLFRDKTVSSFRYRVHQPLLQIFRRVIKKGGYLLPHVKKECFHTEDVSTAFYELFNKPAEPTPARQTN